MQDVWADPGHSDWSCLEPGQRLICVYREKPWGAGLWDGRRHGSLARTSVGVNMTCHWEGIRGYGWKGWPPCPLSLADCMQLWAPLWSRSFAYVWQELRKASAGQEERPCLKWKAKGRVSKHPVYADTYPYIIPTAVHTTAAAKRGERAQHVNINSSEDGVLLVFE